MSFRQWCDENLFTWNDNWISLRMLWSLVRFGYVKNSIHPIKHTKYNCLTGEWNWENDFELHHVYMTSPGSLPFDMGRIGKMMIGPPGGEPTITIYEEEA